jgi:hypothetical protein
MHSIIRGVRVELQQIVERYAEAIEYVDAHTDILRANPRTGEVYHTSFKALAETNAVDGIDAAWDELHLGELLTPPDRRIGVKYPAVSRAKCDHVFSTEAGDGEEWGIEVKKIEFVGNNGKNNDFGVGKMLSPYYKDRGLLHDAARLREHGFTRRVAVVGYAFNLDIATCNEAEALHPGSLDVIGEVRGVIRKNGGSLMARPLIEFTDAILGLRGYLRGPRAQAEFTAFRHPAGGHGIVFGWEIRRPHLELEYDPRHPF